MYVSLHGGGPPGEPGRPPPTAAPGRTRIGGTVVLLGLTSLFTDLSTEMVVAVLPIYVTLQLGLSPAHVGALDALYQGVTAVVRLAGGFIADRSGRPKAVATSGYAVSAAAKLALLPAQTFGALSAVLAVDRLGKGLRTAPRDSLIAAASPVHRLGMAFGIHRTLDTVGALGGPLLAFVLLAAWPGRYDTVFVASFALAVVGVGIIGLLVPPARPVATVRRPGGMGDVAGLLRRPSYRRLLLAAGLLSLTTVSDGLLYLALHERTALPVGAFPLLFVGTSAAYLLLAIPCGRLADRVGRGTVFVSGHVLLLLTYLAVLGAASWSSFTAVALALGALGAYYAATDGVLAAAAAPHLPATARASGLAALQTTVVVGRMLAAAGFGLLWAAFGSTAALTVALAGLVVSLAGAAVLLRGTALGVDR